MQYLKFIIKWLSISTLLVSVTFISLYLVLTLYKKWQKTEITVIALECKYTNTFESNPKWYLFKQSRDGSKPMRLYRGTHTFYEDKSIMPKDRIIFQYEMKSSKDEDYYFGLKRTEFKNQVDKIQGFSYGKTNKKGHEFNRKTLEVRYVSATKYLTGSCKEISKEDFFQKIKIARENVPELYKF